MTDSRAQIQLARIQDNVTEWSHLVSELPADEALKAMLSGVTRGAPGSQVKDHAVTLIVASLKDAALRDLKSAMDAAVTAAIYSKPDSEERAAATAFIVAHAENLAVIDSKLAMDNSNFAMRWAKPGSDIEREAARVWENLSISHPANEGEAPKARNAS